MISHDIIGKTLNVNCIISTAIDRDRYPHFGLAASGLNRCFHMRFAQYSIRSSSQHAFSWNCTLTRRSYTSTFQLEKSASFCPRKRGREVHKLLYQQIWSAGWYIDACHKTRSCTTMPNCLLSSCVVALLLIKSEREGCLINIGNSV